MPVEIGDYEYTTVDGELRELSLVGKPRKTFPLPADTSVYLQEEDYMVFIDYYVSPKAAEPHPTTAGLYWIKDTPISDVGNGVGRFTRTYAKIPGFNEDGIAPGYIYSDYESFSADVPGITSTQELFLLNTVSAYSVAGGNHILTTSVAHDIAGVGKSVAIHYSVVDPINNFTYFRTQTKISLAGTAGSTVVVSEIKDINVVRVNFVQRAASNQEPRNQVVMARTDRDYHLAGTNGINTMDDIPIIQEFFITDLSSGNRTEYLSEGVPGSSPNLSEFRQWVDEKRWIVAESSVVRRWMESGIFERSTRYVRALL